MNATPSIILYVALGLFILLLEIKRKRTAPYDALFFLNISYFIYFVVLPIHILLGGIAFTRQTWIYELNGSGGIVEASWLFFCYILILAGYYSIPSFKSPVPSTRIPRLAWNLVIVSLLIIGLSSLSLYTGYAGGIFNSIKNAVFIRQGAVEVSSDFLFVKHFIPALASAAMMIAAMHWKKKIGITRDLTKESVLIFVIITLILLQGLVIGGRRVLIFPFLILFFLWGNTDNRFHIKTAAVLLFAGVFFLAFWNALSFGFRELDFFSHLDGRYESLFSIYANACQPMADPYIHWVGMHASKSVEWAFQDILLLPAYLLPSRIISGVEIQSVIDITTEMLRGKEYGFMAGEPPGFHGYLYMSGSYLGVITGSLLYGVILKLVHQFFAPGNSSSMGWLIYLWFVIGWAYLLRHGMLEFVLTERFHWWIAIMLLLFWSFVVSPTRQKPITI